MFHRSIFFLCVLILISGCDNKSRQSIHINELKKVKKKAEQMSKKVKIETTKGDIVIELYEDKAPVTVGNFLNYVNDNFYDGLIFHRVIPGFMIQGGGFREGMKKQQTGDPIKNEADNGLKNNRGTLSMARTSDPDSATSQFFINLNDNKFLNYKGPSNPGYAVFAKVTEGMDTVDKIAKVETESVGYYDDVPKEPVVIEKTKVIKE